MTTALAIKAEEVETAKQEIQAFISRFPMTVSSKEESLAAQAAMTTIRKERKRQEEEYKDKVLNHTKRSLDAAKAAYDAHKRVLDDRLKLYKDWEFTTNQNILAWETKERQRIKREQEEENRKYMERMAKAEAKGKEPESVRPPKLVQAAPKTIKAEAGAFTIKEVKELVVFDETKIPGYREPHPYWKVEINKKAIEDALRAGLAVPGAVLQGKLGSAIRG